MWDRFFSRKMNVSEQDPRILVDSRLPDTDYVTSFGFEWTEIDGFAGKEVMSHGHIYGRFRLPSDYFHGKDVVDVGCGNGRIGRLIAPNARQYLGLDLSNAVFCFPRYLRSENVQLCMASASDLPLRDEVADVTICWGVLHHTDDPESVLGELKRITKPGGEILIFIYSDAYVARENFNRFFKFFADDDKYALIESTSDFLDAWREVDKLYADLLSKNLFMSVKQSRDWQIFQWFDGVSPKYHWLLASLIERQTSQVLVRKLPFPGCYILIIE